MQVNINPVSTAIWFQLIWVIDSHKEAKVNSIVYYKYRLLSYLFIGWLWSFSNCRSAKLRCPWHHIEFIIRNNAFAMLNSKYIIYVKSLLWINFLVLRTWGPVRSVVACWAAKQWVPVSIPYVSRILCCLCGTVVSSCALSGSWKFSDSLIFKQFMNRN